MTSWTPKSALAHAVVGAGFWYDPAQDIIYSRVNAWQRAVGYTWAYDEAAAPLHMIIDCEPFYFEWSGKLWMIELWKGQYGLETGAEIGVYRDDFGAGLSSSRRSRFYGCWSGENLLSMRFTLYRHGRPLFRRGLESHWWLTGFKWGLFTPSTRDLVMDAEIYFWSTEMRDAFKQAATKKGYLTTDRGTFGIHFRFDYPREQPQPGSRSSWEGQAQADNQRLVNAFNNLKQEVGATSNDPNAFHLDRDTLAQKAAQMASAAAHKVQHGLASAPLKKIGLPGPMQVPSAVVPATKRQLGVTDEAIGTYRELAGFFDRKVWRVSR
ncbi:MAG TPA: DUF4474 domain-containing protein [Burkholderiales bacterium]|jgi:hypothetical protein